MNFDAIIEYQRLDRELMDLDASLNRSDEARKYGTALKKRKEAGDTYGRLTQEAAELLKAFTPLKKRLAELQEELDGFEGILDDVQDSVETEHYLKLITAITEQIAQIEKEVNQVAQRIDAVSAEAKKTFEIGVQAQKEVKATKPAYDKKAEELKPQREALVSKLKALEAKIAEPVMKKYKALRDAKRLPAFIAYDTDPKGYWYGCCAGCRQELSGAVKGKLKNPGDYAECSDCGRILYIPEK